MISVANVNVTDSIGGAARAAYRLHRALRASGVDSSMVVDRKQSDDWTVLAPEGMTARLGYELRQRADRIITERLSRPREGARSLSLVPGSMAARLKRLDPDVIQLHWTNAGCLSIRQIGNLSRPIVWTMHDMWPVVGSEHYTDDNRNSPWRTGYKDANLRDVDRNTYDRKVRHWSDQQIRLVAPSRWLAECASASPLSRNWTVDVVPNPLPLDRFKPIPQDLARATLGLPPSVPLVLFGAHMGTLNPLKGWDLLTASLGHLKTQLPDVEALVLGQSAPMNPPRATIPLRWMGRITDDSSLALLYSAATVVVVPSRMENLPQAAIEAQSCGTPVVAFDVGGLPDAVEHQGTGYLATPFDPADLAAGIVWIASDLNRREQLSQNARRKALREWEPGVVAHSYREIYQSILSEARSR